MTKRMRLSGEQIRELAEYSDGDDCVVIDDGSRMRDDYTIIRAVIVERAGEKELVRIYETGQTERVT